MLRPIRAAAPPARSSRWVWQGALAPLTRKPELPGRCGGPRARGVRDTSVFAPLGKRRVPVPSIARANER
jgi:hypothetical protein